MHLKDREIEALTPVPRKIVQKGDGNDRYATWKDIWDSRQGLDNRQTVLIESHKALNAVEKRMAQNGSLEDCTDQKDRPRANSV